MFMTLFFIFMGGAFYRLFIKPTVRQDVLNKSPYIDSRKKIVDGNA